MFWGLIMEPNKRYTQVVEKAFHVSMACLDFNGKVDDTVVQVMVCYENRKYVLCNLMKNTVPQMALDLNFETGSKITFISNGNSSVHLTGFHIHDMDDEDDFDEEDLEDVINEATKKRKKSSPEDNRPGKKTKTELNNDNSVEDEEDDSDDEDFMDTMMEEAEDEEMSDEDAEEEEEDDEEDDDDSDESDTEVAAKVKESQEQQKQQKDKKKNKENKKQMNGNASATEKTKEQPKGQEKTLEGGVQIEDINVGSGAIAKKGQMAAVYYVGRLKNGKKFDSVNSGKGLKFRIGRGEVIKGWDIGVAGMKVGGKRRIVVPPSLGYGAKGYPPVIPGNSTLMFEVELKGVN